jgi:uncharacterized protein involved in outer membrane biogenesis
MRVVRSVLKVAGGLVVVLAVLAIVALFFLGPLVKKTVNTLGPKLLGVPVAVKHVAIQPLIGSLRLEGMTIGNPEGYSPDSLFSLKEVRVKINIASLPGNGPIVIEELAIIEPQVAYEVAGGKSNLEALTAKLAKAEKTPEPQPEQKEKKAPRKVIIDLLEFRDGQVSYRSKLTLGKAVPLPLPNLRLTAIGRDQGGIKAVDAVTKVLGELLNLVGAAVAQIGTAALDTGTAAVAAGKDVVVGGAQKVKEAGTAIKGLFKSVTGDK